MAQSKNQRKLEPVSRDGGVIAPPAPPVSWSLAPITVAVSQRHGDYVNYYQLNGFPLYLCDGHGLTDVGHCSYNPRDGVVPQKRARYRVVKDRWRL